MLFQCSFFFSFLFFSFFFLIWQHNFDKMSLTPIKTPTLFFISSLIFHPHFNGSFSHRNWNVLKTLSKVVKSTRQLGDLVWTAKMELSGENADVTTVVSVSPLSTWLIQMADKLMFALYAPYALVRRRRQNTVFVALVKRSSASSSALLTAQKNDDFGVVRGGTRSRYSWGRL